MSGSLYKSESSFITYLDDTYYLQLPAEALAAMRTGDVITTELLHVASNTSKQEVYSRAGDLSGMPATIRGAPTAPPNAAAEYAGGELDAVKVLGAYVGKAEACSTKLVARVEKHLKPLEQMVKLRDTSKVKVAMQVQLEINRFCANTQLNYFLRTMPLAATAAAQARHDQLIWRAAQQVVGMRHASVGERERACAQMRLPVKMGGMGVTSMVAIAPAARVGSWALCWRPLQRLCPRLFGDIDITESAAPSLVELRGVHAELMEQWRRVQGVYGDIDQRIFDYDKEGESHMCFHPQHLPARHQLVTVAEFASESDYLQNAQRTWSQIVHHSAWVRLAQRMRQVSLREAVRFLSVSQPHAGDFLNAVPKRAVFRINTWALRIAVQRRLGLPLTAAAVGGEGRSKHGHVFDMMGDLAANDGQAGCQTRHYEVLSELVRVLKTV